MLAVFGVQGWNCDFQILSTTAYYGLKIWQVVFVGIVINYVVVLSVMAFTMLLSAACKTPFAAVLISALHDRAYVPADKPRQRSFQQTPLPASGKGNGYSCGVFNVCSVQFRQAGHYPPVHDPDRRVCADYRHTSRGTQKIL